MPETIYKVCFSKEVPSATNDFIRSRCQILSAQDQVLSNFFITISGLKLMQWDIKEAEDLAILVKCGLEILKTELQRGIPREDIDVDKKVSTKPHLTDSEIGTIHRNIQEEIPFEISIPSKIGF